MAKWIFPLRLIHVSTRHSLGSTIRNGRIRQGITFQYCQAHAKSAVNTQFRARTSQTVIPFATISLTFFIYLACRQREAFAESEPSQRLFRLDEIHRHNRDSDSYWVFRGDRVYDISDWIPNHPGGEVILRAVGGSIEPYWNIFTIHQKPEVYDILEQYFIGKIDPRDLVDGKAPAGDVDDPFKSDPERAQTLIVRSSRPCNAETPKDQLETFITPSQQHYVRNHLWVPSLEDGEQHRLLVELLDGTEKEYTIADLRSKFERHTITATLQCSGNRRAHMTAESRQTSGLQWDVGAISTADWTGVRLRDVLHDAGLSVDELPEEVKHIQFVGAEAYGASIPAIKAIDKYGDVLLVFEMNGKPLLRDHGFPLRVLVPGHVAARSVKWLKKVIVSEDESWSQWQRRDYKCFGPNEGSNVDWDKAVSIQEMPVQSAITSVKTLPKDRLANSKLANVYGLEEDSVTLRGYAFSGGGREIVRVDVSPDNGKTWRQAQLLGNHGKGSKAWCWKNWQIAFEKHEVEQAYLVKAVDDSYNCQPESYSAIYNFKGNLTSGWHRVPVGLQDSVE